MGIQWLWGDAAAVQVEIGHKNPEAAGDGEERVGYFEHGQVLSASPWAVNLFHWVGELFKNDKYHQKHQLPLREAPPPQTAPRSHRAKVYLQVSPPHQAIHPTSRNLNQEIPRLWNNQGKAWTLRTLWRRTQGQFLEWPRRIRFGWRSFG